MVMDRRSLLAGFLAVPFAGAAFALTPSAGKIHVYKDASCGCCGGWIDHMRAQGYTVTSEDHADMGAIKQQYKVPESLYSCHTALIGDYVIEGHVPAAAVARLLAEKPAIIGLSAPGMPVGSPGMEMPDGSQEPYEVMAFGVDGSKLFARYLGDKAV